MGTVIALSVAGMEVAWSKNHRGMDHGALFQESDRTRTYSDQGDYDYFEGRDETELAAMEASFARTLTELVPRLELLGFTMPSIEAEYAVATRLWSEQSDDEATPQAAMTFAQFLALASRTTVADITSDCNPNPDLGELGNYSERSYFEGLMEFLHPYSILRLLVEAPPNRELDVVWQYGPLVEAGWAEIGEFVGNARRSERFLIATEGSSDIHILKHGVALLRPSVSDFFYFIDVSEGHPFSGTGQLRKFAEGLTKIDVQNQTVFVFDNDAEGVEASQRVDAMELPYNMRTMVLPDHEALRSFPILGPEGLRNADINGRAAAIETYLDLELPDRAPAQATWSNYKKEIGSWHGALDFKESYVGRFLSLSSSNLEPSGYDTSKIEAVPDAIIAKCNSIATAGRIRIWNE